MTARELAKHLLDRDLELPLYIDTGARDGCCECRLLGVRIERDRIVLTFDPDEEYEP